MGTEEVQLHSLLTSALEVRDQINVPGALTPGGWACRRGGVDVSEQKLSSCARRDSNAVTSSPKPMPYIDYAIPANHQVGFNTQQYSN
jgi:hypothetical protein